MEKILELKVLGQIAIAKTSSIATRNFRTTMRHHFVVAISQTLLGLIDLLH